MMGNVVSVLSGKGGVGKSIISLNLATALAKSNYQTLLIDCNLSAPSLNLMLGKIFPEVHLNQYLKGLALERDIVYVHPSGLKVIFNSGEEVPDKQFVLKLPVLIDSLKAYFDYMILDTSPSLAQDTQVAISCSNFSVGVSEPTVNSLVNTLRVLKFSESNQNKVLGLILNKMGFLDPEISIKALKEISDYKILGEIAFSNQIQKSELLKHPLVYLYRNHKLSQDFFRISQFLLGEKYEEMLEKNNKKGHFYKNLGLIFKLKTKNESPEKRDLSRNF